MPQLTIKVWVDATDGGGVERVSGFAVEGDRGFNLSGDDVEMARTLYNGAVELVGRVVRGMAQYGDASKAGLVQANRFDSEAAFNTALQHGALVTRPRLQPVSTDTERTCEVSGIKLGVASAAQAELADTREPDAYPLAADTFARIKASE